MEFPKTFVFKSLSNKTCFVFNIFKITVGSTVFLAEEWDVSLINVCPTIVKLYRLMLAAL